MSISATSRAAELAAQQVESIVAAAQAAAAAIREDAENDVVESRKRTEREIESSRAEVKREVEALKTVAQREAEEQRQNAQVLAIQMAEDARKDAELRVNTAQKAADEVMEDARAVSTGLRRLGESLEAQAATILRDVAAAHKRMTADLRVGGGGAAPPAESMARVSRQARQTPSESSPFSEIDVPAWVDPDQ